MMGSAATVAAAQERKLRVQAANDAFREKKRQLALDKQRAALDAKTANLAARTARIATGNDVIAQRADTEQAQILAPVQTQAQVDVIDTQARAAFVRALPWIVGGVVAAGAIWFLRKRSKGASA